jgi:hypothetical protein
MEESCFIGTNLMTRNPADRDWRYIVYMAEVERLHSTVDDKTTSSNFSYSSIVFRGLFSPAIWTSSLVETGNGGPGKNPFYQPTGIDYDPSVLWRVSHGVASLKGGKAPRIFQRHRGHKRANLLRVENAVAACDTGMRRKCATIAHARTYAHTQRYHSDGQPAARSRRPMGLRRAVNKWQVPQLGLLWHFWVGTVLLYRQ